MQPKAHVSQAIKGLRRWVVLGAVVAAGACMAQSLVFGFVHYTDVREGTIPASAPKELRVVESRGEPVPSAANTEAQDRLKHERSAPLLGPGGVTDTQANVVGGVRASLLAESKPIDPNRIKTSWDGILRETSMLASGVGSVATITLCGLVFLGVVIAGGGAVPGVEKAVTASCWSIVLASLVMPWKDLMPSLPVPGVFATYESLVGASEAARAGASSTALLGQWLVLPMVAALAATLIATWFCAGVRRGVIVTSVSQLERQIEQEVQTISKRGVANSGPRAVGALNRAIGDTPVEDALDAAAGMAASLVREARPSSSGLASMHAAMNDGPMPVERAAAGRHPGRLI